MGGATHAAAPHLAYATHGAPQTFSSPTSHPGGQRHPGAHPGLPPTGFGDSEGGAPSEGAPKAAGGGWLVDLVDRGLAAGYQSAKAEMRSGLSWLRGSEAAEAVSERPAYVYNEEIKAWIPSDMTAEQYLAQEAEQKLQEALKAAPPPPPPPPGSAHGRIPTDVGRLGSDACAALPPSSGVSTAGPPPHAAGPPPHASGAPPPMSSPAMSTGPRPRGDPPAAMFESGASGGNRFARPKGRVTVTDHYRTQSAQYS